LDATTEDKARAVFDSTVATLSASVQAQLEAFSSTITQKLVTSIDSVYNRIADIEHALAVDLVIAASNDATIAHS
jgi:hypothetical protein